MEIHYKHFFLKELMKIISLFIKQEKKHQYSFLQTEEKQKVFNNFLFYFRNIVYIMWMIWTLEAYKVLALVVLWAFSVCF